MPFQATNRPFSKCASGPVAVVPSADMKKNLFVALSVWLLTLVSQTTVKAESRLDFVLQNDSGLTIERVYISSTQSRSWEEDVLGRQTVADGDRTTVRFSNAERNRFWDIKIVTNDGEEHIFQDGYDLARIYRITFEADGDTYKLHYWFR
jgi:hypothetical protein